MTRLAFKVALVLSVLGASASSFAYDYRPYWSVSHVAGEGLSLTIFVKDSPVSFLKNISSLTVTHNNSASIAQVLSVYKKTLGSDDWSTVNVEGLEIHEKVHRSSQTLFRIAYNPKSKQYSVASIKMRFLLPSYLEVHLMQLQKLTRIDSKKATALFFDLFFSRANAQNGLNLGALVSQFGFNSPASTVQYGRLGPSGVDVNVKGSLISGEAVQALNSVSGSANSLGNNGVTASRNVQQGLNNASASIDRVSNSMDDANATLKSTFSTRNVVELTAVATMSGVVFAQLTNFVLSGSWELIKKAYREANGVFSEQELNTRLAAFQKSMESFEPLANEMVNHERKLTILAQFLNESENRSTEEMLSDIDADLAKLKPVSLGQVVQPICSQDQALAKIGELEFIKSVVEKIGSGSRAEVCDKMDSLYSAWVRAEYQLSMARRNIVQNFQVYMGVVNQSTSPDIASQEMRKQKNACLGDVQSQIDEIKSQAQSLECETSSKNSVSAVCRKMASLKKRLNICTNSNQVVVDENLLASLDESATNLNDNIALFSKKLSQLDCAASDGGKCIKLGPVLEAKKELQKNVATAANKCPNKLFAQTLATSSKPSASVASALNASAKSLAPARSSGNFFSRLWAMLFGGATPSDAQVVANQWTEDQLYRN